jgi:hypothetical protein
LRAFCTGQVQWISNHDACHAEPPAQTRQRAKVVTPAAIPHQRQYRLGRQPQLVRHGYSDAAIADIEAEVARFPAGIHYVTPCL